MRKKAGRRRDKAIEDKGPFPVPFCRTDTHARTRSRLVESVAAKDHTRKEHEQM
jgi:hypothetical protein